MRPGPSGGLGLWLTAGPLFGSERGLRFTTLRDGPDDERTVVRIESGRDVLPGRGFELLVARHGRYDLRKELRAPRSNTYALFAGVLRARSPSKVVLQIGADDGVRVTLDGQVVLNRDLWRPPLHDDDVVELDLAPGDHALLIRLRQRSGQWGFRARLLDAVDLLPPRDVQLVLPGVEAGDVAGQVERLVDVDVGLEVLPRGYRPKVRVNAEGGLPDGLLLPVAVQASRRDEAKKASSLYHVSLGRLPVGARRTYPLDALLPVVPATSIEEGDRPGELELRVQVGPHATTASRRGHAEIRRAVELADEALSKLRRNGAASRDLDVVRSTLSLSRERLQTFVSEGDEDLEATRREAREVARFAEHVTGGRDPLSVTTGPVRLAYPSALDGRDRPFGLYVPPSFGTERAKPAYPLVVVLHGLNGLPMQMIRIFFGKDDWRRAPWEDRHVGQLDDLDAFVVSPTGFGNMAYREFGEMDVMHLVRWVRRVYPIDAYRVYVTGLSMGGTGAAAVGLRYADQFAAVEPLCGYHSYALRRDMANRKLRPWESALASFWSNVSWADNGRNLPLYVVHGKKDKPVANSKVLVDRYAQLGYEVHAEYPDAGHNVWQQTYDGFKGYRWLARHVRDPAPEQVVIRTASLRYADHAWVHVLELEEHLSWGRVHARVEAPTRIAVETSGVRALRLDRPSGRIEDGAQVEVRIDGETLRFASGAPVVMHRAADRWVSGAPEAGAGLRKTRGLSGPIRDAFLEPLVFVVGTQDLARTRVNEQVARALANPPYGVEARWPVIADVDVDDATASKHALFLIGSATSNAYVARIRDRLPIRVEGRRVVAGDRSFEGEGVGALFVYPNPLHPDRYVVVLAAPDVAGTLRALSLPRMLPDFVVYDDGVAGARGQIVLGTASLLAGGMFDERWQLPAAP